MPNNELRLEVTTVKQKYSLAEPVVVRVHLFNFGEETVNVNARMAASPGTSGEITFDVVGPSGRKVPFSARVNVGKPDAEHFMNIAPFSGVSKQIELSSYYSIERKGTYTLKVRYANKWDGSEFGLETWTGLLESDKITFEVVDQKT